MTNEREGTARGETRRDFIKKTAQAAGLAAGAQFIPLTAYGRAEGAKVALVADRASKLVKEPPVRWALERLGDMLKAKGVTVESPATLDGAAAGNDDWWRV